MRKSWRRLLGKEEENKCCNCTRFGLLYVHIQMESKMRHKFEVIKDKEGKVKYKCKRCENSYGGPYPTRIPCQARMKLAKDKSMFIAK